jgi:DNA-binding CsgD family transcriptional regulator
MKQEPKLISVLRTSAFQLDPTLTGEEGIVLRSLATGQTDRQVCHQLHMDSAMFFRTMRDMREKIGTADNVSLIAWAKRQIKGNR